MRNLWLALGSLLLFGLLAWLTYWPVLRFSADRHPAAQLPAPAAMPSPPNGPQQRTLKICSDVFMPYAGEAGAEYEGYQVDILRQLFEPLGYRIDYVSIPWSRCVQETREGHFDGLVGTLYAQTPDLVFPESSLGVESLGFYTLPASRWTFKQRADVERIRLGVVQDYDYQEWLDLYVSSHATDGRIWYARGDYPLELLMSALQDGKIDAFVENSAVVSDYLYRHRGRVKLRAAGTPGPATRMYAAFSPRKNDAEALARILDRGIDEMRGNGQLGAILQRYRMDDWRPRTRGANEAQP